MSPVATKERLHLSKQDLAESVRTQIVERLNSTLALTFDLYSQVKQAHWNVKGRQFFSLHSLFDELAAELIIDVDTIAERVTALAGTAQGTARMAAKASILPEYPIDAHDGEEHLTALIERYALYAKHLRENIEPTAQLGDADTADIYTELSRNADKRLWFLEAHVQ